MFYQQTKPNKLSTRRSMEAGVSHQEKGIDTVYMINLT